MGRLGTLLLAAGIASAALAAGCGGGDDDTSATVEWADSVCASFTTWREAMASAADSVTDQGSEDPLEDRVETAVADAKAATETLADDLESLGPPDTEAGQQAKESLTTLADELEQDVEAIEDAADANAGLDAVSTISSTIARMSEQVSATLDELEQLDAGGELADAFEQADSCESLNR